MPLKTYKFINIANPNVIVSIEASDLDEVVAVLDCTVRYSNNFEPIKY